MPLKRIVYVSRASGPRPRDLVAMVGKAWHRNAEDGLSGMLCFSDGCFLQVLEGPVEAVNDTFFRIARDPRHTDLRLLTYESIERRHFDGWRMGFVDLTRQEHPERLEPFGGAGYGPFPTDPIAADVFLHAVGHTAMRFDQAA